MFQDIRIFRGIDQGEHGGNTDTVVGAEGGTLGLDPLAVYPGFDRIGEEIVLDVVVLLGNHIHVTLHAYRR